LDLPENGELPVYPMTAIDEISYRTPDALFNGQAVVNVIQSCVPGIKDAGKIPSMDLNALLVGIRIASYGNSLDIASTCPECKNEDDFSADLRVILDNLHCPDYNKQMDLGDLQIIFKPSTYEEQNKSAMEQFERQKFLQQISEGEMSDEERNKVLTESLKQITNLTINLISKSIAAMQVPGAVVTDVEQIKEFLQQSDRTLFRKIRDHVIELTQGSQIKPLNVECSACQHKYQQEINMDMTSFFETAS
jgi:predicted Zn-ribbon and HTH transcriptional regulator